MKKIHWFTDTTILNTFIKGESFVITKKELVKQVSQVLKLKKGEYIVIKGENFGYECEIIEVTQNTIEVLVLQKNENVTQQKVSLLFCIPKKDKFELILEKCTEIGITDFYPIVSDRTIKTNINIERASKIIQEASEQAQRLDTPTLHEIQKLEDILDQHEPIVFDTDGTLFTKNTSIEEKKVLIGPEGGFSEKEIILFKEKGLQIYKLGDTVLKTETAAIVASGLVVLG